ncbi:MAG TPA: GDSL-type esterase/lipase family protein [Candidatus Methylomirabilis sp.]|nr:GDSL-type esterase/lipase family protein [Candidatus Methylomirabilis sp.]
MFAAVPVLSLVFADQVSIGGEESPIARRKGKEELKSTAEETGAKRRNRVVVILGASYAMGWTDLPLENLTIINKGVGGEQSFEMLARFQGDVVGERPDAVIIWGFINDIFRSNRGTISSTLERTRRNITEMVDMARANGIKPILATEVTIREKSGLKETVASLVGRVMGKEGYQDYINRHVLSTNEWIRTYAREQAVPLLDFQPLLAETGGKRGKEYATDDGSHITAAGYSRLSRHAATVLGERMDRP